MNIADKLVTIAENEQKVYDAGKKAQYDLFWDTIQNKGGIRDHTYLFYNFPGELFNPKYNFRATYSTTNTLGYAFAMSTITDMVKNTDCTNLYGTLNYTWYQCKNLVNARTLIVVDRFDYSYAFYNCIELVEIRFSGTIGKNGLSFAQSTKLSKASIESVINTLSVTTSGLTVTFSKTAVNKAFETSSGANDGSTSTEWTTLRNSKSNWTISLA